MRLRRERKKARLTQIDLARFAGVTQGTISKLETGTLLAPSLEVLERVARALQKCGRTVSAADLQPRRQPRLVKGARVARRERADSGVRKRRAVPQRA